MEVPHRAHIDHRATGFFEEGGRRVVLGERKCYPLPRAVNRASGLGVVDIALVSTAIDDQPKLLNTSTSDCADSWADIGFWYGVSHARAV